jgi:hypothetical protein
MSIFIEKQMCTLSFDNPNFLEPAHFHDPEYLPDVAFLPPLATERLSMGLQEAVHLLEESTSIAYSSLIRLRSLLQQRFDHLRPIKPKIAKVINFGSIACKPRALL